MNDVEQIAAKRAYNVLIASYDALVTLRPESEYHEDMGPVLWWFLPICEAPWVGTPNDMGKEVLIETRSYTMQDGYSVEIEPYQGKPEQRVNVGGWPGYHTHWSPLPKVQEPK